MPSPRAPLVVETKPAANASPLLTQHDYKRFIEQVRSDPNCDILQVGRNMELFVVHANNTNQWRQRVLLETLTELRTPQLRKEKLELALRNLRRWQREPIAVDLAARHTALWSSSSGKVLLLQGDWGDVTQDLTMQHGKMFVVLNMAHAKSPGGGGGYVHGTATSLCQEARCTRPRRSSSMWSREITCTNGPWKI